MRIMEDEGKAESDEDKEPQIDDNMSDSSEEERKKRDRLEQLSKIASFPKDPAVLQKYRLPIV